MASKTDQEITLETLKIMAEDVKKGVLDIDRLISEIEMELDCLEEGS